MSKVDEVKALLEHQIGDVESGISLHMKYNNPWDPLGDSFTEMLHACMYDTKCTGSAGLGWDTRDKGESKYSNRVQARKCLSCGAKVMFFLKECADCGSSYLLKYPKDSRWGVSSDAHLTYLEDLKGYRLTLLEPKEYDPDCREFILRSWFIETKDEYLTAYAEAQFASPKSNHINFLPLGRDFYRSSPCLHLEAHISVDGIEIKYFNPENTEPEAVPHKFATSQSIYEIMDRKSFGKERGDISRR